MATKTTRTPEELAEIKAALELAQATQGAFWDALRELEEALGDDVELNLDNNDLENYDVDDILALADKDEEEEDDEDGRPGDCLTCHTQCDQDGICPICAELEAAEELLRHATPGVIPAAWRPEERTAIARAEAAIRQALDASIGGCNKCGTPLTLRDVKKGAACTDQGEGQEAGRVFLYCSERCRETH